MTGSALLFDAALRAVRALGVPELAMRDVVAVLTAGRAAAVEHLYDAGIDAELPRETLVGRAAALFVMACADKLAGDLAGGRCHYLPEPARRGPGMQYLLQNVFAATVLETGLPPSLVRAAFGELALAAAHHQSQIHVTSWSAATYRSVVEGIAVPRYVASLSLLWAGTKLAGRATEVGACLAVPATVASDLHDGAGRLRALGAVDRAEVVDWAREHLAQVAALDLPFATVASASLASALGQRLSD